MNIPFSELLPFGVCSFSEFSQKLLECRAKSRLPKDAKSIIVYLFPYYLGESYYKNANVSKYAVPADYHIIVKKYLEEAAASLKERYTDYSFEYFCDNSPIPEVEAAVNAGLGVRGENGLLINEKYGSYCFIGEIVTDMAMGFTPKSRGECLKCGVCKSSCPGGSLREKNFQKESCFSHLTQKKGTLSADTENYIKNYGIVWGCDVCQNACPMNKNISSTPIKDFYETAKPVYEKGDSVEGRAFSWRGESVVKRNLKILCCKDSENKL